MNLKQKAESIAAMKAFRYVSKDPDNNIPKLIKKLEKIDRKGHITPYVEKINNAFSDNENGTRLYIKNIWRDINQHQLEQLFRALVVNETMLYTDVRVKAREKYNCNVPWAVLMDPTSACNLKCTGCWAAEYGHQQNLSLEELEDIIKQSEKLGCYIFLYSGGEPLARKKDIITLCERHPECAFMAFTNGTLIDEAFADEMLRVGNFVPAISVEGFEKETDFRRGEGTFKKTMRAMEILRSKKLMFGISCCYTSKNAEFIGSEEYTDAMIDWGAKFAWYFTYMPVGRDAVPELMATAEQREFMYHQIRKMRGKKPIFFMDFWNDGEYVGGCIAGGRCFLHINASGDIEPCAFIHYSDANIRTDRLLDAYRKPLFMAYHDNQPFNDNMLRPCPALDNPEALIKLVEESGAKSTDMLAPESACDFCSRCREKADKWAPVAEKLWRNSPACTAPLRPTVVPFAKKQSD